MKKILIFMSFFLITCEKEPIEDCNCGYIIESLKNDDEDYLLIWKDECSNKLDTIYWFKEISDPWKVGDYICELKELNPDSLN